MILFSVSVYYTSHVQHFNPVLVAVMFEAQHTRSVCGTLVCIPPASVRLYQHTNNARPRMMGRNSPPMAHLAIENSPQSLKLVGRLALHLVFAVRIGIP